MSTIAKKNVRSGDDALANVDPNDMYGDGTNVLVQENDLAFVVTTGDFDSAGYIYKAVIDATLSDDGTRVVEMASGSIVWKRVLYADKNYNSVPSGKLLKTVDGIVPDGYESFLSYTEAWPLYGLNGVEPFNDYYTKAFLYNGCLYGVASDGLTYVYKLDLTTYHGTYLAPIPYGYCDGGFVWEDHIYMLHDNDYYVYSFEDDTWTSYIDSCPMTYMRSGDVAAGKGWIFGSSAGEPTMYNKLYRVNDTTNFSQMTTAPTEISGVITMVAAGNFLYVFGYDSTKIEMLVYNTSNDSWATYPTLYEYGNVDYNPLHIPVYIGVSSYMRSDTHFYYDSIRNSIHMKGNMSSSYAAETIKFDINTSQWSTGWTADLGETICKYGGVVHDPSTDTVYITYGYDDAAGVEHWARVEMCGTNLCKKV